MRVSPRLMANPLPITPSSRQQSALLPPLQLYRRLLRVHRKKLPKDMRLLGDEYVKNEFRAHRNVDNPIHIVNRTWPLVTHFQTKADTLFAG